MRIKNHFLPLISIVISVSLLHACNLVVTFSDEPPTPPVIPSETASPIPSPTMTFTPPPSDTPLPTPTLTLFFAPTATPTRQWSACPGIVVTQADTDKGEMLHILRCEDGFEYDLGPLAKGVYAVGPNDKFLVYITMNGIIYASKIGEPTLHTIFNLRREHIFTVLNIGSEPDFRISFVDNTLNYKLVLLEWNYDQKRVYDLPTWITHY